MYCAAHCVASLTASTSIPSTYMYSSRRGGGVGEGGGERGGGKRGRGVGGGGEEEEEEEEEVNERIVVNVVATAQINNFENIYLFLW